MISEKEPFEAWKKAIRIILDNGTHMRYNSRRPYFELNNIVVDIVSLRDIDKIFNKFMNFSVQYPSKSDMKNFILNKHPLPGFKYSYGKRIFNYNNFNQINDYIVPLLKDNPSSKRVIVSLWDPLVDSKPLKQDTPSLIILEFKIRNNRLNVSAITRSMDFFYGWPSHIYQLGIIQDYVLGLLDDEKIKKGAISTITLNAIIFEDSIELIDSIFPQN